MKQAASTAVSRIHPSSPTRSSLLAPAWPHPKVLWAPQWPSFRKRQHPIVPSPRASMITLSSASTRHPLHEHLRRHCTRRLVLLPFVLLLRSRLLHLALHPLRRLHPALHPPHRRVALLRQYLQSSETLESLFLLRTQTLHVEKHTVEVMHAPGTLVPLYAKGTDTSATQPLHLKPPPPAISV